MRINGTTIVTPLDNPGQYDPDWRNSIAIGLLESGERLDPAYQRYSIDIWVKRQMAYLKAESLGRPLTRDMLRFRLASIWFQDNNRAGVRFRLEPLLLTAVSYEIIALDILGKNDEDAIGTIQAYERIYFNIRDDHGRLSKSCQLKQYFAYPYGIPGHDTPLELTWRLIGALLGYDTLVGSWLWKDAHGLRSYSAEYMIEESWRVSLAKMFVSMFSDRVGHESLSKLLTTLSAQQKQIQDGKRASSNTDEDMVKAMQGMLSLMSPQLVGSVGADVDRTMLAEASAARLRAESAVDAVEIGEVGNNGVKFIEGG